MSRLMRSLSAVVAIVLAAGFAALSGGRAQEATPVPGDSLDLAAMVPGGGDVPDGYVKGFDPGYSSDAYPAWATADERATIGLERLFFQGYGNLDAPRGFGVAIVEATDEAAADAGFAVWEDEDRRAVEEPNLVRHAEEAGPQLGDGPTEVSALTWDDRPEGGWVVSTVDVTVRVGRLLASVSDDRILDPADPANESAIDAALADPLAVDSARVRAVTDLAAVVVDRIAAVLAGEAPPGVDLDAPGTVLPVNGLWPDSDLSFEGYLGPNQLLDGLAVEFSDQFTSGYFRTIGPGGADATGMPNTPWLSLSVARYADAATATAILDAFRTAPDDRPTPGNTPRGVPRTLVADPTIAGADAALATTSAVAGSGPADSVGIVFVVGDRVVSVDVQGAESGDAALEAATELAVAQAACLTGEGPCNTIELPASLADR